MPRKSFLSSFSRFFPWAKLWIGRNFSSETRKKAGRWGTHKPQQRRRRFKKHLFAINWKKANETKETKNDDRAKKKSRIPFLFATGAKHKNFAGRIVVGLDLAISYSRESVARKTTVTGDVFFPLPFGVCAAFFWRLSRWSIAWLAMIKRRCYLSSSQSSRLEMKNSFSNENGQKKKQDTKSLRGEKSKKRPQEQPRATFFFLASFFFFDTFAWWNSKNSDRRNGRRSGRRKGKEKLWDVCAHNINKKAMLSIQEGFLFLWLILLFLLVFGRRPTFAKAQHKNLGCKAFDEMEKANKSCCSSAFLWALMITKECNARSRCVLV